MSDDLGYKHYHDFGTWDRFIMWFIPSENEIIVEEKIEIRCKNYHGCKVIISEVRLF